MSEFKLAMGDLICGSSQGTWTDGECVLEILKTIERCEDAINTPDNHVEFVRLYKEFCVDLVQTNTDLIRGGTQTAPIDLDFYTNRLEEHLQDVLPPYCGFSWEDNELRVIANIDLVKEQLVQYDDKIHYMDDSEFCKDVNPENDDYVYAVNDHGNITLLNWTGRDWQEVWGLV